jgi:hypothetical protein
MFFKESPNSIDGGLDEAEKDLGRVSRSDQMAVIVCHTPQTRANPIQGGGCAA